MMMIPTCSWNTAFQISMDPTSVSVHCLNLKLNALLESRVLKMENLLTLKRNRSFLKMILVCVGQLINWSIINVIILNMLKL